MSTPIETNGLAILERAGRKVILQCSHGLVFTRWYDKKKIRRYRCPCDLKISPKRTHNMKGTPEYTAWKNMRTRCNNPNFVDFSIYGGRGISICRRWDKFENFFEDMGKRPGVGLSLDRIDNDRDYGPDNCRWASAREQASNRRYCVKVTHAGRTLLLTEWEHVLGIRRQVLYERMFRRNWTVDRAFTQPLRVRA